MQQHVTYLVVEDNPEWSRAISGAVRRYFEGERRFTNARVREDTAYDGDQGLQRLRNNKYDLVTLDMNLSKGPSRSKINGLDLLGAIADGNRAFFVLMITGAINDPPDLEAVYGRATAATMRYNATLEAGKSLPPDRVGYLQKPLGDDIEAAMAVMAPLLDAQLNRYCEVSRERNIFRRMPGNDTLWEVRYDGGPRRTIPKSDTLELIRRALANPDRDMKIIDLMQTIARDSRPVAPVQIDEETRSDDSSAETFNAGADADWETSTIERLRITDTLPADTIEGSLPIESLIRGLLRCAVEGITLDEFIKQCDDKLGVTTAFFSVPTRIKSYIAQPRAAQDEFGADSHRLSRLLSELRPALACLQERLTRGLAPTRKPGTKKVRVAVGIDTKEMNSARRQFGRALDYLRRDDELSDFVDHLEKRIERGNKAKGRLQYSPVNGSDLLPFWLTY